LAPIADALVSHALVSLAYACDLGDPDGTILIAGDPSRRHDFGFDVPGGRDARLKAVWGIATVETRHGPWHLSGRRSRSTRDGAARAAPYQRRSRPRLADAQPHAARRLCRTVAAMNGALLSTPTAIASRITSAKDAGASRGWPAAVNPWTRSRAPSISMAGAPARSAGP